MLNCVGNSRLIESDRLVVELASVINPEHIDNPGLIINAVTNAPVSNTNPPKVFAFHFQAAVRTRVFGKSING